MYGDFFVGEAAARLPICHEAHAAGKGVFLHAGSMETKRRPDRKLRLDMAVAIILIVTVLAAGIVLGDLNLPLFPASETQAATAALDAAIGATVEPLDRATARYLGVDGRAQGLVITSVEGKGPAERAGIKVGDVIERIDGEPVGSLPAAAAAFKHAHGAMVFTLNHRGHYAIVQLPIRAVSGRRGLVEEGAVR